MYIRVAGGRTLEEVLANMGALDLDVTPQRRPELWMKHPRSGFLVRTAVPRPVVLAQHGKPGLADTVPGPMGMGERVVDGSRRPPRWLFRAVSEQDWQQTLRRGWLQSDGRMNLLPDEGTVAAYDEPSFYLPGRLASDPPGRYPGRIVRIDYRPEDGWMHDRRDSYAKTRQRVPIDRISLVSPIIVTVREKHGWSTEIDL